ncbi:MAG: TetR/AcrR family transcriptional regulator [Dechloromonas sp.]|nr:TetR/AcrR family transcriptional regulator [Dechloromonas sp.]
MESPSVNPRSRPARRKLASPRAQLDRGNWIESAIDVLARDGLGGLRIEVLAKRCGVTKGSFYWHFKDRQDLLTAMLDYWKEGRIRDIEKTTSVTPGREREQLHFAIEVYGASRNRKGMAIELAVRDWARHDPQAATVVEAVDLYRLECTRKLFVAAGMTDAAAKSRSLLLYACVFGLSLMHYTHFDDHPEDLKQRIADHIVSV